MRHLFLFPVLTLSLVLSACNDVVSTVNEKNSSSSSTPLTNPNKAPQLSVNVAPLSHTRLVTVTGEAKDPDGTIKNVTLSLNGKTVTAKLKENTYEAQLFLKAGNNDITITASDEAGATTINHAHVYFGNKAAAGGAHSGIIKEGNLYTWGRNNLGQTGIGKTTSLKKDDTHTLSPLKINTPAAFVALSFSQNHSASLTQNGELYTWGDDSDGQLGRGEEGRDNCGKGKNNCRLSMGQVTLPVNVVQVSMGYGHTLALAEDGTVWAWGDNKHGQIGQATEKEKTYSQPMKLDTLSDIIQVVAGANTSYALRADGSVWAWGSDQYGNLGQGNERSGDDEDTFQATPVQVKLPEGITITQLASGRDHVLALNENGEVYGWGLNFNSQVGYRGESWNTRDDAWSENVTTPRRLPWSDNHKANAVYANGNTSYLKLSDGTLRTWGIYGEMKDATATFPDYLDLDEPSDRYPTLKNIEHLAIGALHQIAINKDGQVYSWGWNFEGSLGGGKDTKNASMYHIPIALNIP